MVERVEGTEPERLGAEGFLPCGLSQTDIPCPDCGRLLGRFRQGLAGRRYYDPKRQATLLSDDVRTELLFCRVCRRTYR